MRRYTIHLRFGEDYLPMINCSDLKAVSEFITNDEDGLSFKVFDNEKDEWVRPQVVFLACLFGNKVKV